MRVVHAAPHCRSRQFYKGVMDQRSHGVFTGRIVVHRAAQQTDAIQSSRNMLLSDTARMNARPQLEIYADDVRCTHGATTGQVDPEAVFYFRARGLPEDVARAMLIYAFVAEGFDRMQLVPVRALLADELIAKLPMANKLSAEFNEEIKQRLYRI
jgi:Fe-S cluster assembly protein SufD